MIEDIPIGADFDLFFNGTVLRAGGSYLNSGTCTYALKDADGSTVAGGTGSLSYVAASDGEYLGFIAAAVTATLTANALYDVEYTFTSSGITDKRTVTFRARKRGKT